MSILYKSMLLLVVVHLVSACSNGEELKQTMLSKENLVSIQKKINSGKGITKNEAQCYMLGQIKIATTGGQVVGKTVEEVIAAGKVAVAPKP